VPAPSSFFVARIPVDYFSAGRRPPALPGGVHLAFAILRNLAGVILVLVGIVLSLVGIVLSLVGIVLSLVGIVLSLAGIPSQGILTILVGLMLTDLPGCEGLSVPARGGAG